MGVMTTPALARVAQRAARSVVAKAVFILSVLFFLKDPKTQFSTRQNDRRLIRIVQVDQLTICVFVCSFE